MTKNSIHRGPVFPGDLVCFRNYYPKFVFFVIHSHGMCEVCNILVFIDIRVNLPTICMGYRHKYTLKLIYLYLSIQVLCEKGLRMISFG